MPAQEDRDQREADDGDDDDEVPTRVREERDGLVPAGEEAVDHEVQDAEPREDDGHEQEQTPCGAEFPVVVEDVVEVLITFSFNRESIRS